MKTRNVTTDCHAASTPPRSACHRFASTVGTINAASASSGGMNDAIPEIMIIGMAKPTAPFTKPPNSVTAAASPRNKGDMMSGR